MSIRMSIATSAAVLALVGACAGEGPAWVSPDPGEAALADDGHAATRHPIVLIPGLFGFEKLIGTVEYFPAIGEALTDGGAQVFIVFGSGLNSSELRASQIIPELEEIKAITGAERLNLFAHSQGSIDARIIAARRPDLVASVTSIGGPHKGAALADRLLTPVGSLAQPLVGALGELLTLLAGSTQPNDVRAALEGLSTQGMARFNATHPAGVPTSACGQGASIVDGIRYYSWSGVGHLTNPLDLLDPLWLVNGISTPFDADDGLVGRCSSHLGEVIRDDYRQNHIDQTNLLFGLVGLLGPRPQTLFRNQANRLKNLGL
jgi:triacylglycerol lipase